MRLIVRMIVLVGVVLLGTNHLKAQADLEVLTLISPIPGSVIDTGITFDITFTIKNVGTVTLLDTDSILVSLTIASNLIGTASFTPVQDIIPGDSYNFTLSGVPSNYPGFNLPVCVSVEWTQDLILTNNTLCQGYSFGSELVSVNEPVQSGFANGLHYENGQLGFNWRQHQADGFAVRIFDMQGRIVNEQELSVSGSYEGRLNLGLPTLSPGIYFLGIYKEGFQSQFIRFSAI